MVSIFGYNFCCRTAVAEAVGVIHLYIATCLDATTAKYAPGKIPDDERVDILHGISRFGFFKALSIHLVPVRQVLEPAVAPDRANRFTFIISLDAQLKIGPVNTVGASYGTIMIS